MDAQTRGNSNRRLNNWKEIAQFFGRDERTVKRWEGSRGLPVRRLPHGTRPTVYALEHELAAWLDGGGNAEVLPVRDSSPEAHQPAPARGSAKHRIALAAGGGIALLVFAATLWAHFVTPASFAAPPMLHPHASSADAQSFYRAGLYEWQSRTPIGLTRAIDDFTQTIVRDPRDARAYAGLANCYNLLREFSTMPAEEAFPRARAAALRAIALDPSLGAAHAALAFVTFYWSRDPWNARREFERAILLDPGNAAAHHWYANFLMTVGDAPGALSEIGKAQALDSESTAILADKGLILYAAGRKAAAVALLQQVEQTEPAFYSPHRYLAYIYLDRGDNEGFLRESATAASVRHDDSSAAISKAAAMGFAAAGRLGLLQAILDEQKQLYAKGRGSAYAIAASFARLNDDEDAAAWLKLS
ncbi:MAG: tetratricopeptide repeat protein, partial [Rhizomicrobium sp.]